MQKMLKKFNNMNDFYNFRTMTHVPVDLSCVEWDLLDMQESAWIKEYNANVYKTLAPLLSEEEAQWMLKKYLV